MITSLNENPVLDRSQAAVMDADVLRGIINASNDAAWCMEFRDPIDLTAPDHEIIRQVFENGPYWRFVNPAMAHLYILPPGQDFCSRPTSEIFPRNAQNEAFVQNLIDNGFEVDAAPALDTRYDGTIIEVENDVRATVEDGHLVRMFGIVRDVGKHRLREARVRADLNEALDILTALPTGVLAFNEGLDVVVANPAAARLLGMTGDDLLAGALAAEASYTELLALVDRVNTGGFPASLKAGNFVWSLAPRQGGGVVANFHPVQQGGDER